MKSQQHLEQSIAAGESSFGRCDSAHAPKRGCLLATSVTLLDAERMAYAVHRAMPSESIGLAGDDKATARREGYGESSLRTSLVTRCADESPRNSNFIAAGLLYLPVMRFVV